MSDLIGDAMPKKGKVSEVCNEFTVYQDGALALRLQDEEILHHYSGNRMRNAIVRSDFPCAKQQQTQEQVKTQIVQDVLYQQAALGATLAAKIQEELIQQEQKKLSKLKLRDEQMAHQIMLEEQHSHPNSPLSPNLPNHSRQTPHQPEQVPRSPHRQPQSPIYQNIQNQWSQPRVGSETAPNYQNIETPWSQPRASPQTPSPTYKVEPSAWSPARSVSQGQVPSPQDQTEQWSPRATPETTKQGPESRLSPVRVVHQRSSPEHSQYSPSRTAMPHLCPTGQSSPQQRMVSPSREQEHPPRTPPKYVSPPSSHSSPESHSNSRCGDPSYSAPGADLCAALAIPLLDEEEERKRQEERDADLAARLQAEEDKDKGAAEMRDALIAIEQEDRELARMLQQQEKVRYKRAREKAKLKKKQKEAESQQQQNSDDKAATGGVTGIDQDTTANPRTCDVNITSEHKHTKLKSPDILESTQSKSNVTTPSKVTNGSKLGHVSYIATTISPPLTPTTKSPINPLSPLSQRLLYEDDGPVPPYMPMQGHKRNELLEKKKRSREKEFCKQQ